MKKIITIVITLSVRRIPVVPRNGHAAKRLCCGLKLCAIHAHPTAPFGPYCLGENICFGDPGFGALLVRGF